MALFASTLYPQTNPTNPILLGLRSTWRWLIGGPSQSAMCQMVIADIAHGDWDEESSPSQRDHARRVLTRLAALTG